MLSVKTVILLGKNSKNKFDKKYNTFDSALSKHFNFGEANRLKADFINLAVALQGDMVAYGNLLRSICNCSGMHGTKDVEFFGQDLVAIILYFNLQKKCYKKTAIPEKLEENMFKQRVQSSKSLFSI